MSEQSEQKSFLEVGLEYAQGDQYDKAIEYLTLAIEQGLDFEDEKEARGWRTICFGQSGRVKEALVDSDWLIDNGEDRSFKWRAHLKERLNDRIGAIADYTRAIKLDPNIMYLYLKRGHSYFHTEQFSKAIDDFTTALSLEDASSVQEAILEWRGKAHVELGEYQAGLDDFKRAVEIFGFEPHVAGFYYYRGLAREHFGDLDGAIKDYRRAVIDPEHPEADRIKQMIEESE